MWEIMSYGVKPFPELQNKEVIDVIERGERLSRPSTCPLGVYTLMSACWMYRPSDRPNFAFVKTRLRSELIADSVRIRIADAASMALSLTCWSAKLTAA